MTSIDECIRHCEILFKGITKDHCPGLGPYDTREFWVLQGEGNQRYCVLTVDVSRTSEDDPYPKYSPLTTFCAEGGHGSWTDICNGMHWYPTSGRLILALRGRHMADVEMESWRKMMDWFIKEYA